MVNQGQGPNQDSPANLLQQQQHHSFEVRFFFDFFSVSYFWFIGTEYSRIYVDYLWFSGFRAILVDLQRFTMF